MEFKVGQIVFFNWKKSFVGKVIRLFNRLKYGQSGWAHVGIITKVTKEGVQIHEALTQGFVKSFYPKNFIEGKIKSKEIYIKTVKKRLVFVSRNADRYLGRPYGWLDIVCLSLSLILGKWSIGLTGSKHLICSEAVARILYDSSIKKINFAKEYDKPYDLITPMDIFLSKRI